jgi:hypothetical protein
MLNHLWNNRLYVSLILVVLIIGYIEIFSFSKTILHDAIDYYYPWRKSIVESIRQGSFPLWEPYQELGSPIMSNPQSGAWYPILWIISIFGEYNLYTLNVEYVLHLIICGIGSYALFLHYDKNRFSGFIGACIYSFSGFIIGNFQHLSWIISAAWIPILFLSFKLLLEKGSFKYYLYTALSFYFLLSGGYAAFVIIMIYILFFYTLYIIVLDYKHLLVTIKKVAILAVITISISWLYIYSVLINLSNITRGEGLTIDRASKNAFEFSNWVTFLFSFATTQKMSFFHSDISMRNAYLGIFFIVVILFIVCFKRTKKNMIVFLLSFLFLLIAAGKQFYFYPLLYKIMPGISLFKEISLFRYFALLGFIFLIVFNISFLMKSENRNKVLLIVSLLLLVLVGILLSNYRINQDFNHCIIRQLKWQICILFIFSCILIFINGYRFKIVSVCMLIVLELLLSQRLNFPYTVLKDSNLIQLQQVYNRIGNEESSKYLIRSDENSKLYTFKGLTYQPNLSTLGIIRNQPSIAGETSFQLKQWASFTKDTIQLSRIVGQRIAYTLGNSVKNLKIRIKGNGIYLYGKLSQDDKLVVHQNFLPGWTVAVNHKKSIVKRYNNIFLSVSLKKGPNFIIFKYLPKGIRLSFIVSLSLFSISLILLIFFEFKQISKNGY